MLFQLLSAGNALKLFDLSRDPRVCHAIPPQAGLSGVTSHFEYVSQCQSDVGHLFVEPVVWPTSLNMYGLFISLMARGIYFFVVRLLFILAMPGSSRKSQFSGGEE